MRDALRNLPAPDPSPELFQRIVRSRTRGVRVALPVGGSVNFARWAVAATIVTIFVGLVWASQRIGQTIVNEDPLGELLNGSTLWPRETPPRSRLEVAEPAYTLITSDVLDPSRLTEGVWTYQTETTTDEVLTQSSGGTRIRLARTTLAGRPVWMINTASLHRGAYGSRFADTTYLDAASLRPLREAAYANNGRTKLVQTFSDDSGHESIDRSYPTPRSWRGDIELPFPSNVLFVNDWSMDRLTAVLPTFPLGGGWRGTLYQVAFISQNEVRRAAPLNVRVVRVDRVTVPAGTFDCWRVEVETHLWEPERITMWVSRDNGWVVKQQWRGSDYVVNTVLMSHEPLD